MKKMKKKLLRLKQNLRYNKKIFLAKKENLKRWERFWNLYFQKNHNLIFNRFQHRKLWWNISSFLYDLENIAFKYQRKMELYIKEIKKIENKGQYFNFANFILNLEKHNKNWVVEMEVAKSNSKYYEIKCRKCEETFFQGAIKNHKDSINPFEKFDWFSKGFWESNYNQKGYFNHYSSTHYEDNDYDLLTHFLIETKDKSLILEQINSNFQEHKEEEKL